MREERVRLLFVVAWPLFIAVALLPFVVAAPPSWVCGQNEPPNQAAAVADFRAVAIPVIAACATLAAVLLAFARYRSGRERPWVQVAVGLALIAAALATPVGRAYLGFGGLLAVTVWPVVLGVVLLLAVTLLVAYRQGRRARPGTEQARAWYAFQGAVGWTVLVALAAIFAFALLNDGGPVYC